MFSLLALAKHIWLLFYLMYVNSNWTDGLKGSPGKRQPPLLPYVGGEGQLLNPPLPPLQSFNIYQMESPPFWMFKVYECGST